MYVSGKTINIASAHISACYYTRSYALLVQVIARYIHNMGTKDDWNFWSSVLVKTSNGTDI